MSSRYVDHIRLPESYLKQHSSSDASTKPHNYIAAQNGHNLFEGGSSYHRKERKCSKNSIEVDLELHNQKVSSLQSSSGPCCSKSLVNDDLESAHNAWTGTIKRGNKKSNEITEVQLELTEKEILKLNKSIKRDQDEQQNKHIIGICKGPHILLLSILCIPFSFIFSTAFTFCIGTITWYNVYINLSEERTIWHKLFLCPLLIIFFPFIIPIPSIIVALYGMFIQLSWNLSSWLKEWRNLEKGFFVWLCHFIKLPECVPYEIVIIDDPDPLQLDINESPS